MKRKGLQVVVLTGALICAAAAASFATAGQAPSGSPTCQVAKCSKATASRVRHKRTVRYGRIVDTDPVENDNQFQPASGRAFCKRGERVVTGGKQIISTAGLFGGPSRVSDGESAPITKRKSGWSVAFGSDLGGGARQVFRVVVVCER